MKQLDLRVHKNIKPILLTKGFFYPAIIFEWMDKTTPPDTSYTLVLKAWDNGGDKTFDMATGLSITSNRLVIDFGQIVNDPGTYYGQLKSNSTVYGSALAATLEIRVS